MYFRYEIRFVANKFVHISCVDSLCEEAGHWTGLWSSLLQRVKQWQLFIRSNLVMYILSHWSRNSIWFPPELSIPRFHPAWWTREILTNFVIRSRVIILHPLNYSRTHLKKIFQVSSYNTWNLQVGIYIYIDLNIFFIPRTAQDNALLSPILHMRLWRARDGYLIMSIITASSEVFRRIIPIDSW